MTASISDECRNCSLNVQRFTLSPLTTFGSRKQRRLGRRMWSGVTGEQSALKRRIHGNDVELNKFSVERQRRRCDASDDVLVIVLRLIRVRINGSERQH